MFPVYDIRYIKYDKIDHLIKKVEPVNRIEKEQKKYMFKNRNSGHTIDIIV